MFNKILVPLDGSKLAESVLPVAVLLEEILNSLVVLVHVIEKDAPPVIHGENHLTTKAEAEVYLKNISASFFPESENIEWHVHTTETAQVAGSISEHVGELDTDLIVMCTHGRSGLGEALFGSIAQQVISFSKTPLLLIRPEFEKSVGPFNCRKVLLPLDGNPEHELGISRIREFLKICQSQVHLVQVIETFGTLSGQMAPASRLLPGTTTRMLDMMEEEALDYLTKKQAFLSELDIPSIITVERGEPAQVIHEAAVKNQIGLIVLTTHGKKGLEAFWAGSLTAKICKSCLVPLLLIPV